MWAVGEQGVVLKNLGTGWQQCEAASASGVTLRGVSVSGDVRFAVGESGHRRQLMP